MGTYSFRSHHGTSNILSLDAHTFHLGTSSLALEYPNNDSDLNRSPFRLDLSNDPDQALP